METALLLFFCLAADDDGGRPLVPDVIGVLLPRFCVLDPEAGGAGRWPGAWPFPGARRRRAASGKGVGVGVRCFWLWCSPPSGSIGMSCNSISRLPTLAASMASSLQAKETVVSASEPEEAKLEGEVLGAAEP
jgi:hypothetical protein